MPKGNRTNHHLKADWRKLTKSQMKELPRGGVEALSLDLLYFYPDRKCGDHMALMSSTAYRCVICRDQERIESRKSTTKKLISVFGMNVGIMK